MEKYDVNQPVQLKKGVYKLNAERNFDYQLNRVINWDGGRIEDIRPVVGKIKTFVTQAGVGIEALGSPILDAIIIPPLIIISGLTPKNAGFHKTKSANFPFSTEPT